MINKDIHLSMKRSLSGDLDLDLDRMFFERKKRKTGTSAATTTIMSSKRKHDKQVFSTRHKRAKRAKRETKVQELRRLLETTQQALKQSQDEKKMLLSFIQECKRNFFEAGITQPGKAFNLVQNSALVH
jgi:hypothetical protein